MRAMKQVVLSLMFAVSAIALIGTAVQAQTVRLAKQFGISYLPLTIMEEQKLLEKRGQALGLDVKTEWLRFTGGSGMNDALLSGNLDLAAGGVGPMLTIWGKTRSNLGIKAVAALNSMPLYLVTSNPAVKTIADFTAKDKIALPVARTSIQALVLDMAADKLIGKGGREKVDPLTVSLGHPDAMAALMGGRSEITAHFGSAPFMYQELADSRMHKVLDSYEVLVGGPHTFNVVWASTKFRNANPKVMQAFVAALDDSMKFIKDNPAEAAALWVKAEKTTLTAAEAERIIKLPENEWTMVPKKVLVFADYMNEIGLVQTKAKDWREIFFEDLGNVSGS